MREPSKWDHHSAALADPILVSVDALATKQHNVIDFAIQQTSDAPTITKDEAASCSIIREIFRNRKITDDLAEIIIESWRHTTQSKYEVILKK